MVALATRAPPALTPRTITYAEGLSLDLYVRDDAPAPRPVVLVVHGGSWARGDRHQLPALNARLSAQGYAVAAMDYRLAPANPFPAARDDVLRAIGFLRGEAEALGLDMDRLVILGRSAGGQLALSAATGRPIEGLRGLVIFYAPNDMVWSWGHPARLRGYDSHATLAAYLGGPLQEREATYRAASPLPRIGPGAPPTLILHGGADQLVSPTQSRRLQAALEAAGVAHLLVEIPLARHGLDANFAGPAGQITTWAIERFLASALPAEVSGG